QLLVEKSSQSVELIDSTELLGVDDLVEGSGVNRVAEGVGIIENGHVGPPSLGALRRLVIVAVAVELIRPGIFIVVCGGVVFRLFGARLIGGGLRLLPPIGVLIFNPHVLVGLAFLALGVFVRRIIELIGKIECRQEIAGEPAEA